MKMVPSFFETFCSFGRTAGQDGARGQTWCASFERCYHVRRDDSHETKWPRQTEQTSEPTFQLCAFRCGKSIFFRTASLACLCNGSSSFRLRQRAQHSKPRMHGGPLGGLEFVEVSKRNVRGSILPSRGGDKTSKQDLKRLFSRRLHLMPTPRLTVII